jgi:hypothetical protein
MSEADISAMLLDQLDALHHGYKAHVFNTPEIATETFLIGAIEICKTWRSEAVKSARRARKLLEL